MKRFSIVLVVSFLFSCSSSEYQETEVKKDQESKVDSVVPKEKNHVKLLFAGDLLLDRGVKEKIKIKGVDFLFEGMDSISRKHDFFIVNMETPLTNIHAPLNKKYIFRSDPALIPALKTHGITHAILSNNHAMDQNKEGLHDTYLNLNKHGIRSIGYGENVASSCKPTLIKKGKHIIAIFGSVEVPIENWFPLDNKPAICQLKGPELEATVQKYKQDNHSHKIIVSLHWGMEYISTPFGAQQQHAHKLIEVGCDLIVGHHPHVIQTTEKYLGKMIYYSIGNFIFDSKNPKSKEGLLVSLDIDEKGGITVIDFPFIIENCRPIPVRSL
jgi:poly-gamma-glutamate synthesis protein (capsule biosynthesis protein)